MSKRETVEVAVGQRWRDRDTREHNNRVVRVLEKAGISWKCEDEATKRPTKINAGTLNSKFELLP